MTVASRSLTGAERLLAACRRQPRITSLSLVLRKDGNQKVSTTGVVMGTYEPAGKIVTRSFAQD